MSTQMKKPSNRVLVVEDEPSFLSLWKRILDDLGVTNYTLCQNAVEAKKMIETESYELIISDVIMPKISGYDLAKTAIIHNPHCNVVLTTAYSANLSRFDLSDCRFHLLYKPYTDITAIKRFITYLLENDLTFDEMSEDSFSENEYYPQVIEWKL